MRRRLGNGRIDPGLGLGNSRLLPPGSEVSGGASRPQLRMSRLQLAGLVSRAGALLGQLRLLLARIPGRSGSALFDLLAGAHRDGGNATGHLGTDGHGAVARKLAHQDGWALP